MTALNDGLVTIYDAENVGKNGRQPDVVLVKKCVLRYKRRTVGLKRHYGALQAGERVDLLLRVPYLPQVSALDIAVPSLDTKQYRIELIQVPEDVQPPVMDLTLRRLERDYALS